MALHGGHSPVDGQSEVSALGAVINAITQYIDLINSEHFYWPLQTISSWVVRMSGGHMRVVRGRFDCRLRGFVDAAVMRVDSEFTTCDWG